MIPSNGMKKENPVLRVNERKNLKEYCVVLLVLFTCIFLQATSSRSAVADAPNLLSVHEAATMKINDPRTIFVDVRNEQQFETIRIPASINIPAHFLRTKKYLQTMNVILVDEGYDPAALINTGEILNKQGFHISILAGGIAAWQQQKKELTGEEFAGRTLHFVPASALKKTIEGSRYVKALINVSETALDTPFPGTKHLPVTKQQDVHKAMQFIADLQLDEKSGVLLFTEQGDYDLFSILPENGNFPTIFFLTGGFAAYSEFAKQHQAMLQPRESRLITIGGCETCPAAEGNED